MAEITAKMGYRLRLVDAKIEGPKIEVTIANDGWARLARQRDLELRVGGQAIALSGPSLDQIGAGEQRTYTAQLPDLDKAGQFCISAPDPNESLKSDARYAIRFANADRKLQTWRDGAFCFKLN